MSDRRKSNRPLVKLGGFGNGFSNENVDSGSNVICDGIYFIEYFEGVLEDGACPIGDALAVVRGRSVMGADRLGGLYEGYVEEQVGPDGSVSVRLWMQVPHGGRLLGDTAGQSVTGRVTLEGVLKRDPGSDGLTGECAIGGQAVALRLSRVGALPT